jgi:hypothetical protein
MITEEFALGIFEKLYEAGSPLAKAYGINIDASKNGLAEQAFLSEGNDVYELLDLIHFEGSALIWDAIAVTTTGWAAPIDPDNPLSEDNIPPSKHPKKMRVYMMCIVTSDCQLASVLKVGDEQPDFDTTGTGDLAIALKALYTEGEYRYEGLKDFLI